MYNKKKIQFGTKSKMPKPLSSINKIELRNFKCFKSINVDFSKVTLLTGANSSGKSSLIYGILSALQTDLFPLYFSPNGKYTNMGDFVEFSYKHKTNNEIGIDFNIIDEDKQEIKIKSDWTRNSKTNMPRLQELEILADFVSLKLEKNTNYKMSYRIQSENIYDPKPKKGQASDSFSSFQKAADRFTVMNFLKDFSKNKNSEEIFNTYLAIKSANKLLAKEIDDFLMKDDLKMAKGTSVIINVHTLLNNLSDHLSYISSFREIPERTYYKEVIYDRKIGKYGENFVQQIVEWENEDSARFHQLNSFLRNLGLLNEIKTKRFSGGRIELRAKPKKRSILTSILDVGFGVSQLLPILVADLQLPKGSTLIISQPEIHLHPSVQASFADYIATNVVHNKKNYILETHSEYLINRIRLNIAKNKLNEKDVKTYYFENTPNGSIVHDIELTKKGEIKNAPKGFFDTYMMDVMNIAMES